MAAYEPKAKYLAGRFRLKMSRDTKDFIMAYVFKDRATMREWVKMVVAAQHRLGVGCHRPSYFNDAEAVDHSWYVQPDGKHRNHDCGWVAYHMKQKGVGVVAHEMAHASNYYLDRIRMKHSGKRWDERNAWTVGWLCHQFVKQANRAGIYK